MKGNQGFKIFVSLFAVIFLLSACNIPGTGGNENSDNQDSAGAVETSVALTVAAQSGDEGSNGETAGEDSGDSGEGTGGEEGGDTQPEATATFTPTLAPSATPSIPVIHVSVDTNCRYGPGVVYDPPVTYLPVDVPAQVLGKNPEGTFYYIDKGCYVWNNYVTVEAGNINSVPIFTPVPTPTPSKTFAGTWETSCALATCGEMTLQISGNDVTGTYANGDGEIEGTINNDKDHIAGVWKRNGFQGTIDFWLSESGKTWVGNYDGNTAWCGTRPNDTLPNPCKLATWYGTWITDCGVSGCGQVILEQDYKTITGTYAGGAGYIEGTLEVDVFNGTWNRNNTSGSIQFFMLGNGKQFQGNFGGTNKWCGYRSGSSAPSPCLKP